MARLQLHIEPRDTWGGETVDVEPLDISTALVIANINLAKGAAEIWDGQTLLCRLVKHGAGTSCYWEIDPGPSVSRRAIAAKETSSHM